MTDYSIVIPVYFNEGALTITLSELLDKVIRRNDELSCEIIFVDDGSEDGSLNELLQLQSQYPAIIKVIKLTRNFGQLSAILAGLSHARGQCTVIMSADNQDPAELVNDMLHVHIEESYDIVICTREEREEPLFRVWTSRLFYGVIQKLSFPNMPAGGFDYVLLSRRVVKTILNNQEAAAFFQGQILWTGYRTKFIRYQRKKREIGRSRWTFGKKLTYLIDGVMAYSFFPIRIMSTIGIVVALTGLLYAAVIFVTKLIWGLSIQGWAPLMIVILVLGGLQMLMLGVSGEYIWRILAQVRNREPFIIETIYDKSHQSKTE
jgi:glycosyltransferase involved in cell wall biosynthesis